jgi:hypothetical protein
MHVYGRQILVYGIQMLVYGIYMLFNGISILVYRIQMLVCGRKITDYGRSCRLACRPSVSWPCMKLQNRVAPGAAGWGRLGLVRSARGAETHVHANPRSG